MTLLEEVYSGYSSERYRVEKSIALLHDDESPIYVEANDNDIVTVIWMAAASRYLGRIPFAERLILVDWNQTAWMPLGNGAGALSIWRRVAFVRCAMRCLLHSIIRPTSGRSNFVVMHAEVAAPRRKRRIGSTKTSF